MRASSPNGYIPNVIDNNLDQWDWADYAENMDAIDARLGLPTTSNKITQAATLPVGLNNTTDRGTVYYLTAPDSGFPTGTIALWDGAAWRNIRSVEIHSALPTEGNFDGRMVLLTAASGGFAAWTLIRHLTGSWYTVNQGIEISGTVPTSGNFAGRVVILSAANGGFNAFDVIRYDGAAWKLVGPQPVPPGYEIGYKTVAADATTINTTSPGDTLVTFDAAVFENVKYYLEVTIPQLRHSVADTMVNFLLRESALTVGDIMQAQATTVSQYAGFRLPFTPSAGSKTYSVTWYGGAAGTATIKTTGIAPAVFRIVKA